MRVLKVAILLTTVLAAVRRGETKESEEVAVVNSTAQKLLLKKSEPYERSGEDQSFLSKFKNWIFPGNNVTPVPDSKAVAGHHPVPLYVAPPGSIHSNRPDCNPCNKEPWIPIATNYGQNTLIGFVPQSAVNNFNHQVGPHQQYGVPQPPIANNFNHQVGPHQQYEVLQPPIENYGPPPQAAQAVIAQSFLIPPRPVNQNLVLLPPAPAQNVIPNQNYGAPPVHLGPPPPNQLGSPIYGPPKPLPNKNYLPPRTNLQQVPKIPNNFINPPPNVYLPPKPGQYIPPPPRFIPKQRPSNFAASFNIPFGMKPPSPSSFVTNYGVPPTSQIPFANYPSPNPTYGPPIQGQALPHAGPSDSYGSPLVGSNVQFAIGVQSGKKYLPPPPPPAIGNLEALPSIKIEEFDEILQLPDTPKLPLPLPNLNQYPMAPLRAPQNFLTDFQVDVQESRQNDIVNNNHIQIENFNSNKYGVNHPKDQETNDQNVQIIPSIPIANFVSSIEYPINLIQSPIVEVAVNPSTENKEGLHSEQYEPPLKLSQNPIVVDNYPSSSNQTLSYSNFKRDNDKDVQSSYSNEVPEVLLHPNDLTTRSTERPSTSPPNDYNWSTISPSYLSSSMVPPTPGPSVWLSSTGFGKEIYTTTPKPKQVQIIIPYTKQSTKGRKVAPYNKEFGSKLSLYTQPPTTDSEWVKYGENPTMKPEVINIKDFLKQNEETHQENFLPYDVLSFQKNIDDWTAQEYSKQNFYEFKKLTTPSNSQSSKEIPKNFFITKSYDTSTTPKFFDHEAAGSIQKEKKVHSFDNFETNFIIEETTPAVTTTEEVITTTEVPETTIVTYSEEAKNDFNARKEKVYVVTPEPLVRTTTSKDTIAFSHPPKIGGKTAKQVKDEYNTNLRLILSEWPHLINNLETTTNKSTSPHPLFGLMGISSYIAPKNSTVETYSGHSKVITIVTPVSVPRNSSKIEVTTDKSKT